MENEVQARVAANVRQARLDQGLSLEALAGLLGKAGRPLSLNTLSRIENGLRRIDVDDLVALGTALGVPPGDLLAESDQIRAMALVFNWNRLREVAADTASRTEASRVKLRHDEHMLAVVTADLRTAESELQAWLEESDERRRVAQAALRKITGSSEMIDVGGE